MAKIIFDFDGTIADSMWVIISIYEQLLKTKVTPAQIEAIRGMPAVKALGYMNMPLFKTPKLLTKGKKIMRSRLHELDLYDGMAELIKGLHKSGHTLEVMTSNNEDNVRVFLKDKLLDQYFDEVIGGIGLFAKAPVLKKVSKITSGPLYYVGDEVRDVEAAKKAKLPIIAVGWGYNNEDLLMSYRPDFFVEKPRQILEIVNK